MAPLKTILEAACKDAKLAQSFVGSGQKRQTHNLRGHCEERVRPRYGYAFSRGTPCLITEETEMSVTHELSQILDAVRQEYDSDSGSIVMRRFLRPTGALFSAEPGIFSHMNPKFRTMAITSFDACSRDSFIVARGDDGNVSAFLNLCRHRGGQVCRNDLATPSASYVLIIRGLTNPMAHLQASLTIRKHQFELPPNMPLSDSRREIGDAILLASDVNHERVLGVIARERADAVGAQELVLIEHPRQHAAKLVFIERGAQSTGRPCRA